MVVLRMTNPKQVIRMNICYSYSLPSSLVKESREVINFA